MSMSQEEQVRQISAFAISYRRNIQRIEQLKKLTAQVVETGGLLTLSRETLEDDLLSIHVEPSIFLPYLARELEEQEVALAKRERQARHILEIINT
jgi:hypothetical protein